MRLMLGTLIAIFLFISAAKANDFNCLVEAIYHEARSEDVLSQLAVANVILTRVESSNFPNTICKVVHQGKYWKGNPIRNRCHFSYWCDGKSERMTDLKSLIKILSVAEMALKGTQIKQTVGATHYHAAYVTPFWSSDPQFKSLGQIGTHIFYIDMRE
jgi:spore germination cell wall hydrolase CwlJ-like protein